MDGPVFSELDASEKVCSGCSRKIYISDAFRFYERIDEEHGASGILSYALTGLEQIVLVHLIRSVLQMKPALLQEILFIKDGPLAFFGMTAPLRKPMRELMAFLSSHSDGPLINLIGLEKSGAFVEHAAAIEQQLGAYQALVLDSEYIYKYVMPGDALSGAFGGNTYYGTKVIFKGPSNDMYVGTVPATSHGNDLSALINGAQVLRTTSALRCSMYDNALIPVALANKLVSLADVPSAEILRKFAESAMR